MECIILAGGLGTRLRGTIGDYPKCMAPVNERPFLHYLFVYLQQQGCSRVVLSLGYKHEIITGWLEQNQWPFEISWVIEEEPLGTGGGIQLALRAAKDADVAVLNGDTLFRVDLAEQFAAHRAAEASATLALKRMTNFSRYGVVNEDEAHRICSFEEKQQRESGLINGGVYILNKNYLLGKNLPEKFSFEKDFLEAYVGERAFLAYTSEAYFIDIGIPEDYLQVQEDFKTLFA
ncbi:MAG: nucleotidyltransferase family protein [Flavipsychrobacter sp.]|nr:nucleotidyltransferase family protein [Flavipsychrobacter sp.]